MNAFKGLLPTFLIALFSMVNGAEAVDEENKTLNDRQRAIIPIAAFTAIGDMPGLKGALNDGLDAHLTVNEVKEILVHSYAYAGFPRALNGINAFMVVLDARKERGIADTMGKEAAPIPSGFDRTEYGHQVRNSLVGRDISDRTSGYPAFVPVIDQFLVEHLFADIFYRDVLNHQERELVTISILSSMAGTEPQLEGHLSISMRQGFTRAQLEEFVEVLRQKVTPESAERATEALGEVLEIHPAEKPGKSLKVTRSETPERGSKEYFTGHATIESRFSSEISDGYQGAIVNFEAGARTAWHTHPLGQTLIVTSGRGLVQSEGDNVQEILPGDVVWIPANERHWHGAAPDSPMSHVAISTASNGVTAEWMEHVDDEQYGE